MIIPMSGGDMYAVHTVVPGAEHRPLVILCHGLMMNCALNPICGVAECLSMAGYDTIRFDFRGSGRSRGDITKMTPLTESADLLDIMRYACRLSSAVILSEGWFPCLRQPDCTEPEADLRQH